MFCSLHWLQHCFHTTEKSQTIVASKGFPESLQNHLLEECLERVSVVISWLTHFLFVFVFGNKNLKADRAVRLSCLCQTGDGEARNSYWRPLGLSATQKAGMCLPHVPRCPAPHDRVYTSFSYVLPRGFYPQVPPLLLLVYVPLTRTLWRKVSTE